MKIKQGPYCSVSCVAKFPIGPYHLIFLHYCGTGAFEAREIKPEEDTSQLVPQDANGGYFSEELRWRIPSTTCPTVEINLGQSCPAQSCPVFLVCEAT